MAHYLSEDSFKDPQKCLKFLWEDPGLRAVVWQQLVFRRTQNGRERGTVTLSVIEFEIAKCKESFYLILVFETYLFCLRFIIPFLFLVNVKKI